MLWKIIFSGILGFVFGVLYRSFFDFGFYFLIFLLLISLSTFLVWKFFDKNHILIFISIFFLLAPFGSIRFASSLPAEDFFLEDFVGEEIKIRALVVDEPDIRETHVKLRVEFENSDTKALVITEHFPEYKYGDFLEISGELTKPLIVFGNSLPGEREFRYRDYLAKDGIYYDFFFPEIEILERGQGALLKRAAFSFKESFLLKISKVIPEPSASLLGGLLVGAKQSLGKELLEDFRIVGLIHIVVLSGFNVMIVARAIMKSLSFLSPRISFALAICGIIFFAIIAGAGPATVRASIMAVIGVLALWLGRESIPSRALVLAGFLMILWNPKILVFDVGFQLSFIATLGLIYLAPIVESKLTFVTERFTLREVVVATISAQIAVLPWLLYTIGDLSIVALLANLLVLPIIPVTMLFGFLTGALGFIAGFLSAPFAWITYALLWYELKIVEFFSNIPFASIHFGEFSVLIPLILYLLISLFVVHHKKEKPLPVGNDFRPQEGESFFQVPR